MTIRKVFIANRGEIACRIERTASKMGIASCGVYTPQDSHTRHTRIIREIRQLPGGDLSHNYLNQELLIETARSFHADAIHPGYGFLSENPEFAEKVKRAGLTWIGPDPDSMRKLGGKIEAKQIAASAGVPVAPWKQISGDPSTGEIEVSLKEIGLPLLIKAAHGGGGRGQRVVRNANEFEEALRAARSEATRSFGSGEVFLERFLDRPRHVEVQILGDAHGNILVFGERDCSLQRRNQKVVEEAPASILNRESREKLHGWAWRLANEVSYKNAGTIEFLAQQDSAGNWEFFFMELNARLQVEHPVTEMIFGIDLVELQFRAAQGENLASFQRKLKPQGHAVELRLCAEDPSDQFLPAPGPVTDLSYPTHKNLRIDSGFEEGDIFPPDYDSLFSKMIVHAQTREACIQQLQEILDQTIIGGIITNKYFLSSVLDHQDFRHNDISIHWIQDHRELIHDQTILDKDLGFWGRTFSSQFFVQRGPGPEFEQSTSNSLISTLIQFHPDPAKHGSYSAQDLVRLAGAFETSDGSRIRILGWITRFEIFVSFARVISGVGQRKLQFGGQFEVDEFKTHHGPILAQVPGVVLSIRAKAGEIVERGQPIITIEAMKIEMPVSLPVNAKIVEVPVQAGERIQPGQTLVVWEPYN